MIGKGETGREEEDGLLEEAPRREKSAEFTVVAGAASEADLRDAMDPANQSLTEALRLSYRVLQFAILALAVVFIFSGFETVRENRTGIRTLFGAIQGDGADAQISAGIVAALALAKNAQAPSERNKGAPLAVGLEAVRAEYQPTLDDFVMGKLNPKQEATQALKGPLDWDRHWPYPIERYAPVFEVCRALGLPLVALGTNAKDLKTVEASGMQPAPAGAFASQGAAPPTQKRCPSSSKRSALQEPVRATAVVAVSLFCPFSFWGLDFLATDFRKGMRKGRLTVDAHKCTQAAEAASRAVRRCLMAKLSCSGGAECAAHQLTTLK